MSNEFRFRRQDGKAIGTNGWSAEHEAASCLIYTGLYRGNKVVALLVAKGDYDTIGKELDANGEFIVKACNAHEQLVASLKEAKQKLGWLHSQHSGQEGQEIFAIINRAELALAVAEAA